MGVSPQKRDEKTALSALDIDPEVLLTMSTDPLLLVDASGAILFANPMANQLVGNSESSPLTGCLWDFITPEPSDAPRPTSSALSWDKSPHALLLTARPHSSA